MGVLIFLYVIAVAAVLLGLASGVLVSLIFASVVACLASYVWATK